MAIVLASGCCNSRVIAKVPREIVAEVAEEIEREDSLDALTLTLHCFECGNEIDSIHDDTMISKYERLERILEMLIQNPKFYPAKSVEEILPEAIKLQREICTALAKECNA